MTGNTLLVSTPSAVPAIRAAILWFARAQHADGAIPASPIFDGDVRAFDYNAYWVAALNAYVLHTGDTALAKQVWPELVKLMDTWYPAQTGPEGLLVNLDGPSDYAGIHRRGGPSPTSTPATGARFARRPSRDLARGGREARAGAGGRWAALRTAFDATFWDEEAGAYLDSPTGPKAHPQDGNAFAILAGFATGRSRRLGADYIDSALGRATATRSSTTTSGATRAGAASPTSASIRSWATSRCSRATRRAGRLRRSS